MTGPLDIDAHSGGSETDPCGSRVVHGSAEKQEKNRIGKLRERGEQISSGAVRKKTISSAVPDSLQPFTCLMQADVGCCINATPIFG